MPEGQPHRVNQLILFKDTTLVTTIIKSFDIGKCCNSRDLC